MSVALLIIFVILMALGVPIAISLGSASVIVLITMGNMPLTSVIQLMYTSMNSFIMVAVPLFILSGSIMDEGGIADKIYDLADSCVGWIYGGLGHVSVLCNICLLYTSTFCGTFWTQRITVCGRRKSFPCPRYCAQILILPFELM